MIFVRYLGLTGNATNDDSDESDVGIKEIGKA